MNNQGSQDRSLGFLFESTDQNYHCTSKTIIGEISNGGVYWCDSWRKGRGNITVLSFQSINLSPNFNKASLSNDLNNFDKNLLSTRWTFEKHLTEIFPDASLEIVVLSSLDWNVINQVIDGHSSIDVVFFNYEGNEIVKLPAIVGSTLKRLGVKQIIVNSHFCGNQDYRIFQKHFTMVESFNSIGYPHYHKDVILYGVDFWSSCRYQEGFASID